LGEGRENIHWKDMKTWNSQNLKTLNLKREMEKG
jgi:hypothetical protein